MEYILESGYVSLNKKEEELCGDKVEIIIADNHTTMVLADGLGSGVKANILATLTSKILCTMIAQGISLEESIETILKSLPICKVRGIAYSTFSILHLDKDGQGYLVEFDNPDAILIRNGKCIELEKEKVEVMGKRIFKTEIKLQENDVMLMFSDGVMHAGVGKVLDFGWSREEIKNYLARKVGNNMSGRCVSALLADACNDLYLDMPGDDTTVAAIKLRKRSKVNIMVGPPLQKDRDEDVVSNFLKQEGKKIVCGGTSSNIVARYLGKEVKTSLDYLDPELPPIGHIEGIDLTTEGVITLRRLLELSEKYISVSDSSAKSFNHKDGGSMLANLVFEEATDISFFVGTSINIAHQGLPIDITMKLKLVEKLTQNLKLIGKNVEVTYY